MQWLGNLLEERHREAVEPRVLGILNLIRLLVLQALVLPPADLDLVREVPLLLKLSIVLALGVLQEARFVLLNVLHGHDFELVGELSFGPDLDIVQRYVLVHDRGTSLDKIRILLRTVLTQIGQLSRANVDHDSR